MALSTTLWEDEIAVELEEQRKMYLQQIKNLQSSTPLKNKLRDLAEANVEHRLLAAKARASNHSRSEAIFTKKAVHPQGECKFLQ